MNSKNHIWNFTPPKLDIELRDGLYYLPNGRLIGNRTAVANLLDKWAKGAVKTMIEKLRIKPSDGTCDCLGGRVMPDGTCSKCGGF